MKAHENARILTAGNSQSRVFLVRYLNHRAAVFLITLGESQMETDANRFVSFVLTQTPIRRLSIHDAISMIEARSSTRTRLDTRHLAPTRGPLGRLAARWFVLVRKGYALRSTRREKKSWNKERRGGEGPRKGGERGGQASA